MELRCCASSSERPASSIFFFAFCSTVPNISYCVLHAARSFLTSFAFSFIATVLKPIDSEFKSAVMVIGPAIIILYSFCSFSGSPEREDAISAYSPSVARYIIAYGVVFGTFMYLRISLASPSILSSSAFLAAVNAAASALSAASQRRI